MITYKYKAQDENGNKISGVMQAQDEYDLHEKLKSTNKYLISAKAKDEKSNKKRLKSNIVSEFSKNIGELLKAGVTLVKALRIVSEDESIGDKEREVFATLLKDVKTGIAFSDALSNQGEAFPPLFINMIRSSESGGNMDDICMQMAAHYDKEYKLNQKVKSAMTYPKLLCGLLVVVILIIMGYVIPQFESLFSQMEELPISTKILLGASDFVVKKWYILLLFAIILFVVLKLLLSINEVRYKIDKFKVHMPVAGKLQRIIYSARFARTLSSLYSAGVPIITCLYITRDTIGNKYIESQFDNMISDVRAGESLSTAIEHVDGFNKKLASTVNVGEETGALDDMLLSIADQMDYDAELAINKLVSYLEPAMIVVMAILVGFIIISVIQPIYGSYETISNSSSNSADM